ncbi:MAG: hypothetical protein RR420_00735 [Anaerovoracaceae bacterium]
MTMSQWLFTYKEVCESKKKDIELDRHKMDVDLSKVNVMFDALAMCFDRDAGAKYMEVKNDLFNFGKSNDEVPSNETHDNIEGEYHADDTMSAEDADLLNFMSSVPGSIEMTQEHRNVGRFVLPTVDLNSIKAGPQENLGFEADNGCDISEEGYEYNE